jgi:serine phosphatase RsbU (regulator of sigma subunit)
MNDRRERFAEVRLLRAIDRLRDESLETGMDGLLAEVAQWQGDERAYDDISILAVELSVVSSPHERGVEVSVSPHASTRD